MTADVREQERFKGVFALLLTPFQADKRIDWAVYDSYVDWQLQSGAQGLFAVCGSSEMKWLTLEERLALAARTANRANRTPVVASANLEKDFKQQEEEVRRMCETGVSGVVLVPPETCREEEAVQMREQLSRLAELASCPVMLYELPPARIEPRIYAELAAGGGIFGIKDTTCTVEGIRAKIAAAPGTIVYQANTPLLPEAIGSGAQGIMSTVSTVAAKLTSRYFRCAIDGQECASRLHRELVFLDGVLKPAFPATAKYAVELAGLKMPAHTRKPVAMQHAHSKAVKVWYDCLKDEYYL
ncbi:MAG: dihydrodipicolinate synthase family protein [Paenibacillus sp.]|jgi:4-hydroxy-tetrahydrodipicolinate synthase|nr:dihydrodipicolinate synthase family protein [Paenibacillus sp.]